MKKIGAFVGKFLPPHVGHESVVEKMIKECDECVVVVSDNPTKSKILCEKANFPYFDSKQRLNWFEKHYKNTKKVHFAIIDESKIKNTKNFFQEYALLFWQSVPFEVNIKYGDESYRELNEKYFPSCKFVAIDRDRINIHGTDIRKDFQKNKKFVLVEAREDIDKEIESAEYKQGIKSKI